uniref:rRNA maturation RNase YbeY n=1 Tax=Ningiella ruwaisensis TaxID=2364274 RepID=UPI001F4F889B|nr:rRNA maturation RNase YbeY [Ningiella ruwaisensis]
MTTDPTSKSLNVYIEIAEDVPAELSKGMPSEMDFVSYIRTTLSFIHYLKPIELGLRVVSYEESKALNFQYRRKDKATNVLSFPSDTPDYVDSNYIGDLAICAQVLQDEATEQNKDISHHWAHLCVHGVLHLLGYDHINDQDADEMESIETGVLAKLGIDDPYTLS